MMEINFGNGNLNFGVTWGKVGPYYTKEIAPNDTKIQIFTTKVNFHLLKIEGEEGLQVDLKVLF